MLFLGYLNFCTEPFPCTAELLPFSQKEQLPCFRAFALNYGSIALQVLLLLRSFYQTIQSFASPYIAKNNPYKAVANPYRAISNIQMSKILRSYFPFPNELDNFGICTIKYSNLKSQNLLHSLWITY